MSVRWRSRVFNRLGPGRHGKLSKGIAAAGAAVLLLTLTDQVMLQYGPNYYDMFLTPEEVRILEEPRTSSTKES